jgi:hypothetical protein
MVMKHIISVSLGSSQRNGRAVKIFGSQECTIERIGTDGNKQNAIRLIRELDGKVDAFGIGGTDLYIYAGNQRYTFRETAHIAGAAQRTPIVDGSGIKNTLERRVVAYLQQQYNIDFQSQKVLLVCAVDRFGLAEALVSAGSKVVFGDLMFGLGVPVPIRSLKNLNRLARMIAPVVTQFPVDWFYPTGKSQTKTSPRFEEYFQEADIIAGDFHFIRRYSPENLNGKLIITNTVTKDDEEMLKNRGVRMLATTTPEIGGRSYGTNIVEGILVALSGKSPHSLTPTMYADMLDELGIEPRVQYIAD